MKHFSANIEGVQRSEQNSPEVRTSPPPLFVCYVGFIFDIRLLEKFAGNLELGNDEYIFMDCYIFVSFFIMMVFVRRLYGFYFQFLNLNYLILKINFCRFFFFLEDILESSYFFHLVRDVWGGKNYRAFILSVNSKAIHVFKNINSTFFFLITFMVRIPLECLSFTENWESWRIKKKKKNCEFFGKSCNDL